MKSISIPDNITTIGNTAFWGCESLEFLDIPSSVTTIGKYTFYGCKSLERIIIPDTVTTIGTIKFKTKKENIFLSCIYDYDLAFSKKIRNENFQDCNSNLKIIIRRY